MHRLDRDTQLEPIGEGRFRGCLDRGWWIIKGPNGGYMASILLRSMLMTANQPDRAPRSLTVHYLSVPEAGAVEVAASIERNGRSLTTVMARMTQQQKLVALAIGALGKPISDYDFQDVAMPQVDPPEACALWEAQGIIPNAERYEMRHAIGGAPWSGSPRALTGGWIRPKGERMPDALLMAAMADAWYPSIFTKVIDGKFAVAVPTVDFTIHFRAELPLVDSRPDDYYLARFESTTARQGYIDETGEMWSRSGVLLAQCRQLALLI